jgi:hypothetical protein
MQIFLVISIIGRVISYLEEPDRHIRKEREVSYE